MKIYVVLDTIEFTQGEKSAQVLVWNFSKSLEKNVNPQEFLSLSNTHYVTGFCWICQREHLTWTSANGAHAVKSCKMPLLKLIFRVGNKKIYVDIGFHGQ